VLTRPKSRPAIEAELANLPEPRPEFVYADLPRPFRTQARSGWRINLHYVAWQLLVRWRYRRLISTCDLVHHVTFNQYASPGCWWFCGRPVVLGPLGGGQVCSWRFWGLFGRRLPWELLRSARVYTNWLSPWLHLSHGSAAAILVANQDTLRRVPRWYRHKMDRLLETGLVVPTAPTRDHAGRGGERVLWIGGLHPWKACALALRALALARQTEPRLRLSVVGDGPQRQELVRLAETLGLRDAVTWHGQVPRDRVGALLVEHDLLLFTSVRDTSGNVVLEAMAAGLPVLALRHQGVAEITTDDTAVRVLPRHWPRTVAELAAGLVTLGRSPPLRERLGAAGRQRAEEMFTWGRKSLVMNEIYQRVTGQEPSV